MNNEKEEIVEECKLESFGDISSSSTFSFTDKKKKKKKVFKRVLPVTRRMKVGRNDPCSCGSGKKYKKCCLRNVV